MSNTHRSIARCNDQSVTVLSVSQDRSEFRFGGVGAGGVPIKWYHENLKGDQKMMARRWPGNRTLQL